MNVLVQEMLNSFEELPDDMQYEVIDFIDFLKQKYTKKQFQIKNNLDETEYVLNNPVLMQQIADSQKTFAEKTGFIPTQDQLDAIN